MHAVKCTQCGRSLTIHRAVVQAKIRCPACGAVFVGTTHPVEVAPPDPPRVPAAAARPAAGAPAPPRPERPERPDSPGPLGHAVEEADALAGLAEAALDSVPSGAPRAPASLRPTAPPAAPAPRPAVPYYVPHKSHKALHMGLLLGFFILFLGASVFFLVRYHGTEYVEIRDSFGNVIRSGRVTAEEAARWKEEATRVPEPNIITRPAPARAAPGARRGGGAVKPSLSQAELEAMGEGGAASEFPEVPALPEDPKITAMRPDKVLLPGSTDTGTLIGIVNNKYDSPLQDLQLTPQIVDPKGRIIATLKAFGCSCVPAGGTARYSVKFEGVPEEMIDRVRVSAKVVPMAKDMVCYDVEDKPALDWQGKTVTATGTARNLGLRPMAEAYVYAEFCTREWIFIRSARGTLTEDDGAGRITAGRRVRYKVQLMLEEGEDAQRVQQALVRVVGKEE